MRIAYFTNTYARASDTFIRNEVVELRARGHVVHTFAVRKPNEAGTPSPDVAAERSGTCYILSVAKATLALTIVRTALLRPAAVARGLILAMRVSPDGVHARVMHLFYFLEAVYLAARLRELDLQLLHNHIAENSATVAMLAAEMSGVPFSMTVHGPGIFFHPQKWALREKIARAAFTACISEFCRSQCMLHSQRADWPKLQVVRCGVGREFEHVYSGDPPQAPRLVFVGRLCDEKGLPLLLEAVARNVSSGKACELLIAGDGPLREFVERFIAERDLSSSIRLLGWQGSNEIAALIVGARALVLPSFAEGLPVVIMEALALGRPVVTTAIAGIPELVEAGRNGWLVPPGSVDALADAIGEATAAPVERLRAMGDEGRHAVRERHSLTAEIAKLEALLVDVIQRHKAAATATVGSVVLASNMDRH